MTEFYAGQIAYQDLVEPKTVKVAAGVGIKRGQFCTMDANGYLETGTIVDSKATTFKAGLFVALQSVSATTPDGQSTTAGYYTCQVACVRSRVVMKGGAGITLGMPLQTGVAANDIVAVAATSPPAHTVIGTAYEFPGAPDKIISKAGDLVVVDLGIGVS